MQKPEPFNSTEPIEWERTIQEKGSQRENAVYYSHKYQSEYLYLKHDIGDMWDIPFLKN